MFRYVFEFLILALLLGACADIPRDNVLDPKNPDSHSDAFILIEAFVNSVHPSPYNSWAVQGLESIKETYGERVLIAEYHRDLEGFEDPNSSASASQKYKNLQDKYVQGSALPRAVPDVFINGAANRISGAADENSVAEQASSIVENMLSVENYYRIEPQIENSGSGRLTVSCKVARLASKSADGLKIRLIFVKDYHKDELHRVVLDMSLAKEVGKIKDGGYRDVEMGDFVFDQAEMPGALVVALLSEDERTVLQSVKQDL